MPESPSHDITRRPTAVIGAGTLGRRIALMLATRGGEVRIFDIAGDQQAAALGFVERELPGLVERLSDASAGRVEAASDLSSAVADAWLVIEALPERLELKKQIFTELDRLAPAEAILATNSSSYPSSQIIDRVSRPERVLNTHFYMPPQGIAVEVMSCGHTDERIIDLLMRTLPAYGLVPFRVRKESVGFIYNRIWAAIKREALAVLAEGIATPEEVDSIFELSLGARRGPFRAMDNVGLDVVLDIEEHYAAVREGIPEPRASSCTNTSIGDGSASRVAGASTTTTATARHSSLPSERAIGSPREVPVRRARRSARSRCAPGDDPVAGRPPPAGADGDS